MAPKAEPPKRGRGRPANAPKPAGASLNRPDDYEADVDEVRPKKRGRPKKTSDGPETAPQKRDSVASAKPADEPEEPAPPKRKRGRPSLEDRRKADEAAAEQRRTEAEGEQPQETRRSRRKAPQPAQEEQQQPEEPEPTETAPRKKRGRAAQSRQKPAQEDAIEEEEAEEEAAQPPRKRGRPSLGTLPSEDANNKGAKATRPKKKSQRPSDANTEDAENNDENQPKKRGRRPGARTSTDSKTKKTGSRPSRDEEPDQEQQQQQQQQEAAPKPKRRVRRSHTAPLSDADSDAPPSPPKPYLHVAPQTRRIRASTIAAKWSPLSGASLPRASALLALAHRPILQRTAATRHRRQHAEAALHLVARRVARKLARGLPFPPATGAKPAGRPFADADAGRAAQLDFESVLDGRAALERQLGPAVHAVELLRAEQQRVERELERDYETLRRLEASARAQTRERKEQMKKAHVLAPTKRPAALQNTQDRSIVTSSGSSGNVFKDMDDPELQSLGLQLAGHVESIRGNLQQGDGITPQLSRTRAALQSVLMRHLEQDAYEQVVLG